MSYLHRTRWEEISINLIPEGVVSKTTVEPMTVLHYHSSQTQNPHGPWRSDPGKTFPHVWGLQWVSKYHYHIHRRAKGNIAFHPLMQEGQLKSSQNAVWPVPKQVMNILGYHVCPWGGKTHAWSSETTGGNCSWGQFCALFLEDSHSLFFSK